MSSLEQSKTEITRNQNDQFRKELPNIKSIQGRVMLTQGIQQLTDTDAEPAKFFPELFQTIREYDDFSEDNDPHGEHDFGSFTFQQQKCFWKIDYYALDMKHGAEDPSDVKQCMRVLTIMLASEY